MSDERTTDERITDKHTAYVVSGFSRTVTDLIAETLATAKAPASSSFQAEDVVLVHLLREVNPDIPVLFLETFHHFPQTLVYRDEIARSGIQPDQPRRPSR